MAIHLLIMGQQQIRKIKISLITLHYNIVDYVSLIKTTLRL